MHNSHRKVIDFGVIEEDVGYYAGYITSSFFLAQLLSRCAKKFELLPFSFFWGYLSDVRGRRIVLLIGLLGNASENILLVSNFFS